MTQSNQYYEDVDVSGDLLPRILISLEKHKIRAQQKRLFLSVLLMFGSFVVLCLSGVYLRRDAVDSGFLQFLSIIPTDWREMMTYGQSFFLTLAESAPVADFLLVLTSVFGLLVSLKLFFSNLLSLKFLKTKLINCNL